jgi:hypothetical protein
LTRFILCSGNHDLDERNADGEKIARWIGDVRELGVACDGDSLAIGDTLFTVCPWWDGPKVKERLDSQLRGRRAPPALDLGASCAARRSPTSWGGSASSAMPS